MAKKKSKSAPSLASSARQSQVRTVDTDKRADDGTAVPASGTAVPVENSPDCPTGVLPPGTAVPSAGTGVHPSGSKGPATPVADAPLANVPATLPISTANPGRSWANLFKDNRKLSSGTPLDQYEQTGEPIRVEFEDIDTVEDSFGHCLVGCFMGRHPGRTGVEVIVKKWAVPCSFHLHRSGWVIYKFDSETDKDRILSEGPYFVFGIPLFLKNMPRCFLFDEDGRQVPAWVQIHGLPPDCWTHKVLSLIGSEIGKPLFTDRLTRTRERLAYARLLIEVDVAGPRILKVPIELPTGAMVELTIRYEVIPDFCDTCHRIGHAASTCRKTSGRPVQPLATDTREPAQAAAPGARPPERRRFRVRHRQPSRARSQPAMHTHGELATVQGTQGQPADANPPKQVTVVQAPNNTMEAAVRTANEAVHSKAPPAIRVAQDPPNPGRPADGGLRCNATVAQHSTSAASETLGSSDTGDRSEAASSSDTLGGTLGGIAWQTVTRGRQRRELLARPSQQ